VYIFIIFDSRRQPAAALLERHALHTIYTIYVCAYIHLCICDVCIYRVYSLTTIAKDVAVTGVRRSPFLSSNWRTAV